MHCRADRDGGVAAGQPVDRYHDVVDGGDAQAAQLGGDRRGEQTGALHLAPVRVREGALPVIVVRGGGELRRVLLGELDTAHAGRRPALQLEAHPSLPAPRSRGVQPRIVRTWRSTVLWLALNVLTRCLRRAIVRRSRTATDAVSGDAPAALASPYRDAVTGIRARGCRAGKPHQRASWSRASRQSHGSR